MSRTTRLSAVLVAITAGAGGLAAAPLLADHKGDRPPGPRPGSPAQMQPGPSVRPAPPAPLAPPAVGGQVGPRMGPAPQGAAGDPSSPRAAGGQAGTPQGVRRGRSFRVTCEFVKAGTFDPIVFPGQDPAGHEHQFFGSTTIDASSTPASLVAANADRDATSCGNTRNGSAYWMPALQVVDDPQAAVSVKPDMARVWYSAPRGQRVRAFPAGFTLIAGDKAATTLQDHAGWRCEFAGPRAPLSATPPDCATDEAMVGVVRFPNCWDGTTLTSPTQSHMAYRTNRTCPATHPVALPEMTQEVFWPSDGQEHEYALSSGNPAGLHADFMNGWDQAALRNQVRRWLNRRG